jgi:hypothetical protein
MVALVMMAMGRYRSGAATRRHYADAFVAAAP